MISTFLKQTGLLALTVATTILMAGCGSGSPTPTSTTPATTTTTLTPAGTTIVPAPSLTLSIVNSSGTATTSISSLAPATVKATLIDANGVAVPNTVVTFTTDATLATMTPAGGTALTNASGVASITLNPASFSSAGAATISASAQVQTVAATGSVGFSIGATTVAISTPSFGAATLSAFGTTSVTATVSIGGVALATPQTVNFTSACAGSGKASLSTGITTVAGIATASYRDMGCAGTDTVTATVGGGLATSSASLIVTPPTAGSIQFVSASPALINLKGTGGTESSQVVFKVLDQGGNPISGKTVTFAVNVNATAGGITLTPTPSTAISDSSGLVQTIVNSGTVSTPVRVSASTPGTAGVTLNSTSNALTITTGIPDQDSFSLSRTLSNIEGLDYDGTTTVFTARLADHFNNPAPDGTPVNFTSEGGSIVATCSTIAGACDAIFTSQNLRPSNGRITVLAYAVGEESFVDLNGNGWADLAPTNEMIDANAATTDLAEAYVDYNENGSRDAATEPFIDFNNDSIYTAADGKYSGVLCDNVNAGRSSAGTCAATKTSHVRNSAVVVLSGSFATITINGGATVALNACVPTTGLAPSSAITVTVVDKNNNAMPVGTTVEITTDNGTIVSGGSYIVQNTTGCRTGGSCPATAASATFGDIPGFTMKSDATYAAATSTCTNASANGSLTVKVTTPKGNITIAKATVTD